MRRVVITGLGIVSCIGNNKVEVLNSLLNTKSGIVFSEEHKKYNFRSQIVGAVKINLDELIDNYLKLKREYKKLYDFYHKSRAKNKPEIKNFVKFL